jgi:serine/threonine protein kinase
MWIHNPWYMPPEVLRHHASQGRIYDQRKIDIWSLGIILIEMTDHHVPYSDASATEAAGLIIQNGTPRLRDPRMYSDASRTFLLHCLAVKPVSRLPANRLLDTDFGGGKHSPMNLKHLL